MSPPLSRTVAITSQTSLPVPMSLARRRRGLPRTGRADARPCAGLPRHSAVRGCGAQGGRAGHACPGGRWSRVKPDTQRASHVVHCSATHYSQPAAASSRPGCGHPLTGTPLLCLGSGQPSSFTGPGCRRRDQGQRTRRRQQESLSASASLARPGAQMPRCAAPGVYAIADDTHGLPLLRLQCPRPQWSRPVRIDVCSDARYGQAQPGFRSAARMRATAQNGSSRPRGCSVVARAPEPRSAPTAAPYAGRRPARSP